MPTYPPAPTNGGDIEILEEVEADAPVPDAPQLPGSVARAAQEADDATDDALGASSPVGDFTVDGLNTVVTELNKLLPKFGIEEPYEDFTEDSQTLPPEFMRMLMMVAAAAKDAAMMDLAQDLERATTDQDMIALAGKLRALSDSADFERFLNTNMPEQESAAPEVAPDEPLPAAPPTSGGGLSTEDEDLFAARV
jgi:hypothetical protein